MKFLLTVWGCILAVIVVIFIVFTPPKCEHTEKVEHFVFASEDSSAYSYVKHFCDVCDKSLGYGTFKGKPSNSSWIEVIKEHSDSDEIVGGEYYTMTATMTLGDYDFTKTRISCEVQSGNIIVHFSAEFKDEFEDAIKLVEKGESITFRGKFYDNGCGFTDCALLDNK